MFEFFFSHSFDMTMLKEMKPMVDDRQAVIDQNSLFDLVALNLYFQQRENHR